MNNNKFYTVKQVAAALGFSTNTIYKYLDEGRIVATRLGKEGRFRIPESEIIRLLGLKGQQVETVAEIPQPQTVAPSPLSEAIVEKVGKNGDFLTSTVTPSLFDWFVGILAIFLGVAHFLFPLYLENSTLQSFSTYLEFINVCLIIFGIVLIGEDILVSGRTIWHTQLHLVVAFLFAALAFIFWKADMLISVLGNIAISALLLITVIYKLKDIVRFTLLILILAVSAGAVFLYRPQYLPNLEVVGFVSRYPWLFGLIWYVLTLFVFVSSIYSFRKQNQLLLLFPFSVIAIGSLIYAFLSFSQGLWERVTYAVVLASFALIAPFWRQTEIFSRFSKKTLAEGFAWFAGLIIIGTGLVMYLQHSFKNYVSDTSRNSVVVASKLVDSFISDQARKSVANFQSNDELITLLSAPTKDTEALTQLGKQFYLGTTTFKRVGMFDSEGIGLAFYPLDSNKAGEAIADQRYFQEAKTTKRIVLSDLSDPTQTGTTVEVVVSAPVVTDTGEFVGIVSGYVDFPKLVSQLDNLSSGLQGNFVIANGEKTILYHPQTTWLSKTLETQDALSRAVDGESGQVEEYDEQRRLSLQTFAPIKSLRWGIVMQQPLVEVLKRQSTTAFAVFLVTIISGVGSLVAISTLKRL